MTTTTKSTKSLRLSDLLILVALAATMVGGLLTL